MRHQCQASSLTVVKPDTGRVPGIEGLLSGQPWSATDDLPKTTPGVQLAPIAALRGVATTPTLPDISSFGLISPSTTAPGTVNSSRRDSYHPDHISPVSSDRGSNPTLDIQVHPTALAENGSWFDPNSMFFKIVHEAVGGKSTDELRKAWWQRTPRPQYGENHTSTRGHCEDDVYSSEHDILTTGKSVTSHKKQEQDRRVRHRILQADVFDCTPDILFNLSEEHMPSVKINCKLKDREDRRRAKSQPPRIKASAGSKAGKDDQLLAASMIPALAAVYIHRLEHDLLASQREARKVPALETDNMYLRHELEKFRTGSTEVDFGIRNDMSLGFSQSFPPPSIKRTATNADLDNTHRTSRHLLPPFPKQRRLMEPISRLDVGPHRRHLPPSPTPSCDEASSSFCTS